MGGIPQMAVVQMSSDSAAHDFSPQCRSKRVTEDGGLALPHPRPLSHGGVFAENQVRRGRGGERSLSEGAAWRFGRLGPIHDSQVIVALIGNCRIHSGSCTSPGCLY